MATAAPAPLTRPHAARLHPQTRAGLALAACGAVPLCAARALSELDGATGAGLPCGFRELTGLPCPLCGATRALALTTRGSADALRYNAVWALAAVVLLLTGVLALASPRLARRVLRLRGRPAVLLAAAVAAAAWSWALLHRDAIVAASGG